MKKYKTRIMNDNPLPQPFQMDNPDIVQETVIDAAVRVVSDRIKDIRTKNEQDKLDALTISNQEG